MMSEDDFIARYFAPLTPPEAFGLKDDGASLISLAPGEEWVITSDMMLSDVHLPKDTKMEIIARHLLLVNLSDIAAQAAIPHYVILNLAFSKTDAKADFANFAAGLKAAADEYQCKLLGGDSTAFAKTNDNHGWMAAATLLGRRKISERKLRCDAKPGDILAVTGFLGDAAFGLSLLQNQTLLTEFTAQYPKDAEYLQQRYYLPTPRIAAAQAAIPYINALMDISDGVIMDAKRMAKASNLGLILMLEKLPASDEASHLMAKHPSLRGKLSQGGDDYELLMSTPPQNFKKLCQALAPLPVTQIGKFDDSGRIIICDNGVISDDMQGFDHFT